MAAKYDFSGWATKNDLKCADGRTIRRDAFKGNDGQEVPLVWAHQHNSPDNVLGHALLENRPEGVYAYGKFNKTQSGQNAKELVEHGDIKSMSIWANNLQQSSAGDVYHGVIREVSLVYAPANPGAEIEFPILAHGLEADDRVIIKSTDTLELCHAEPEEKPKPKEEPKSDPEPEKGETVKEVFDTFTEEQKKALYFIVGSLTGDEQPEEVTENLHHADEEGEPAGDGKKGPTVKEIFDSLNEKQKKVAYFIIGQVLAEKKGKKTETPAVEHSDLTNGGETMSHNIFDTTDSNRGTFLSHEDYKAIFADAKRCGSLRDAVLAHMEDGVLAHAVYNHDDAGNQTTEQTYGIADINYLFPDARTINNTPDFIQREQSWVKEVMNGTHHTPFSRVKSIHANITMDEARARGYIKGKLKKEEVFSLLKRSTDPQTIYKKQKLDRDDVIDITDFDVVAWLKSEMRMMLDEEIARAILIGDGRLTSDDDHISEDHVRPVATDADLYTIKVEVTAGADDAATAKNFIRAAIKSRKDYKGSGSPTLFTTEDWLTEMLLLEDGIGHMLYESEAQLATKLRVRKIVTVPVMEGYQITVNSTARDVYGIIVNLADYNVGADKGGAVAMFDDFDIDYNQQKYLIETRISGALVKPYSAIVLHAAAA